MPALHPLDDLWHPFRKRCAKEVRRIDSDVPDGGPLAEPRQSEPDPPGISARRTILISVQPITQVIVKGNNRGHWQTEAASGQPQSRRGPRVITLRRFVLLRLGVSPSSFKNQRSWYTMSSKKLKLALPNPKLRPFLSWAFFLDLTLTAAA